jgi:hypothetical protein
MHVTEHGGEPTFSFQFQSARAATISSGELLFDDDARSKSQMGHHYSGTVYNTLQPIIELVV